MAYPKYTMPVRIREDQHKALTKEVTRLSKARGEIIPLSKYLQGIIDEHLKGMAKSGI